MSAMVKNEKCVKCEKILSVTMLKENDEGIGKICIDTEACAKRLKKLNKNNLEDVVLSENQKNPR